MDLRQQVLDLCNPSDLVVLDWITKQLDDFPIEVDQTPESYITARARSINVTVDDPSESEPSQSPASIHQPELEPELDPEGMAIQTKPNGEGGGEEGKEGAPIDGGVISSDDDENEVIIVDDQEDEGDEEDPIAGYDEDDVVLLRPERISQDDEPMESATTSRTNSSSPQPNSNPEPAPPSPPPLSAAPSSSSSSSSLPAPPSTSSIQPATISPSLLQAPTPAPPAQAPLPRIQTLASSSSHSKSKSPSPAPDEAGSPSSTTPTSTQPPSTLAQSDYRPYLSDALITKSPVSTANKLISLLSSSPSLFIPASDRSEILHAMNKSGNSRYYAAWVANPDGMDVLAGWLKGLTGKESEPWRATAVVLLEVIKKMEVTKEMLVDKKKKFVLGRLANKVAGNAALTEKVRSLAQSIVDTYSKILGIAPAVSTSSGGGGGNDEGSNKKRKVDSTTNGSSSSSTKPTTSSTLKPSSTSSSTKPPSKPLAKAKPSGPAAKTDTSWFAKPVVHAAPVKKPSTTSSTASSSSSSSAPRPTTTSSSSAPATSSSSGSNVFQQALTLTGSSSSSSSSTLGKRPISAVDGSNLSGGGKKKKTITWRDDVRPERGLEDVRVFEKAGWEIQFEGTHDQTLAQLDKDEGRSMKGHVLEDPMELKDIEDEMVEWYEPRPLLITPDMLQNIYPYTGLHASERLAINQGTLETIYLSPADIPDSPAEPDPSRIVEDGPATRYYEAVVPIDSAPLAAFQQQPLYPPPPPASAPLGLANLDLGFILSQLNSSGSLPLQSSSSNPYPPPPPTLPSSSSSSYYPGIPPPQNNEYNPSYGPPPPSSYNNQYNQPGPSSYTREGGGGALPPQQQMHESSFGGGGKRKGPGGGGEGNGNGRGGKKGRQQQHDGGGGGGGNERPWGNNDGGGGFNARDQLERERNKRGPCKFFNSGRCAKGSTCEFRH